MISVIRMHVNEIVFPLLMPWPAVPRVLAGERLHPECAWASSKESLSSQHELGVSLHRPSLVQFLY